MSPTVTRCSQRQEAFPDVPKDTGGCRWGSTRQITWGERIGSFAASGVQPQGTSIPKFAGESVSLSQAPWTLPYRDLQNFTRKLHKDERDIEVSGPVHDSQALQEDLGKLWRGNAG